MTKLAIVGGGLSGLSAAYYIGQQHPDWTITVYEEKDHLGGKLQTKHIDGYSVEMGPDSYLARKPAMGKLVTALGLQNDVVANHTDQAYIYDQDRLFPIPGGSIIGVPTRFWPFAETHLLSWSGKVRAILDYFKRPYPGQSDVSMGDFFEYHLGSEMITKIIEPLLSGIYGGSLYQLSLDSSFPQFHHLERQKGNLIRGMLLAKRQQGQVLHRKPRLFRQLKHGLSSVIDALVNQMPTNVNLLTNQAITDIEAQPNAHYQLIVNGQPVTVDQLVITTGPDSYQNWFKDDPAFDSLRQMPQGTCAVVMMSFDRRHFDAHLKGTGFVITRTTDTPLTACTFVSNKWAATTPKNRVVLRVFIGKPGDDTVTFSSEDELGRIGLSELQRLLHFHAQPLWIQTNRLCQSMPQYTVGHRQRVAALRRHIRDNYPGLHLIGMPFDGVGMSDCVRQAQELATAIDNR